MANTVNRISFVASLANTIIPKLVAKIKEIMKAYVLVNIDFNARYKQRIPDIAAIENGRRTISALIFPKIKQDKFTSQKYNGERSKKFSLPILILIQLLLFSISFAIVTNFVSSVSIKEYPARFMRNPQTPITTRVKIQIILTLSLTAFKLIHSFFVFIVTD